MYCTPLRDGKSDNLLKVNDKQLQTDNQVYIKYSISVSLQSLHGFCLNLLMGDNSNSEQWRAIIFA